MNRLKYLAMAALVAFAACDEGDDIAVVTPVTGTVTGTVSAEGSGVSGVTVTLAGPTSQTTTTGSNGSYTFSNVAEGAYSVTISGAPADYVFSSTTKTAVISTSGQTVTVDFGGNIVRSASISGQVTASGVGVGGVSVAISGPEGSETKQTGASGNFAFTGLRAGSYTVTITNPDASSYSFGVTSQTVNLTAGEAEVVNFAGTATQPGRIEGSVLASGNAVGGATITIAQGGTTVATRTTNSSGSYGANVDPGTYTVTLSGYDTSLYSFTTTTRTVEVSAGETEDVSFGGAQIVPGSISGVVFASGEAVGGVTVTLSGDASSSVVTGANGAYQFANLAAGSYTVTISGFDTSIYTFTTTSQSVTLAAGGSEVASFTGTKTGTTGAAASVAIQRIVAAGTLVPLASNALTGNMVIQVAVDEGDQEVTQLDVLVNGTVVCSQSFSAGTAGPAGVGERFDVDCTWNSAALDAANDPLFTNGAVMVSARIQTANGATRTATLNGTLANADLILTTVSTPQSLIGPGGLLWNDGAVTVTGEPVRYSGGSAVTSMTFAVGPVAGATYATLTATSATNGVFSVTFPEAVVGAAAGGNDVAGLTTASLGVSINTIQQDGNVGPAFNAATLTATGANPYRYDNAAPVIAAGLSALPASRWINGGFAFSGLLSPAGAASFADAGAAGASVGGVTVTFEAGTSAATLQPVTTGADLAESLTNNTYVVRATATDALGNSMSWYINTAGALQTSATAAPGLAQIGVDIVAPVILGNTGTLQPQEAILPDPDGPGPLLDNSTIALNLQADNLSGYSGTPVRLFVNRYTPSATTCVVDGSAATGCQPASFGTTFDFFVDPVTGWPTDAYYRTVYYAVDQANNASATTTQTNIRDVTPPTTGGVGFDATLNAGSAEGFSVPVSDNLDLNDLDLLIQYGGGNPFLLMGTEQIGGFGPDDGFVTSTVHSTTVNPFIGWIEFGGTGWAAAPAAGTAISTASMVRTDVTDFAGNANVPNPTAITASIVAPAQTLFSAAARGAAGQVTSADVIFPTFAVGAGRGVGGAAGPALCRDLGGAAGCPTNPTSATASLVIQGASGQLVNHFTQVYFYTQTGPATGDWTRVATASTSITDTGVGGTRTYTYSASISSTMFGGFTAASIPPQARTLAALGVTADGTAVWITQPLTLTFD